MQEHLPEVLAFDVCELRGEQRKVEANLDEVVPVYIGIDVLTRIFDPAVVSVPCPGLVPEDVHTIDPDK